MKWLLMWLNVSVATLNATLQLLVIYRFQRAQTKYIERLAKLNKYCEGS